jgi:NAD-dependent deacetylase
MIPRQAKQNGATIIEINPMPSNFTPSITDIFLQGPATLMMEGILSALKK